MARFALMAAVTVLVAAAVAMSSQAGEVDANTAGDLVRSWLDRSCRHMDECFSSAIRDVAAVRGCRGSVLYFVVSLDPCGFVVVAGDDSLEPIIAFSDTGVFEQNESDPLYVLLQHDMESRFSLLPNEVSAPPIAPGYVGRPELAGTTSSVRHARVKWRQLLAHRSTIYHDTVARQGGEEDASLGSALGQACSISDVHVAPLLQSRWSQGRTQGYDCYNYYTPNNYVSGCVATAMAQLMRYHRYPTGGIGLKSGTISVNGVVRNVSTRGGDGAGGAYDWSLMPLVPEETPYDEAKWAMIGSLCYDAGVAVRMMYTSGSSGAYPSNIAPGLKDYFGYSSAVTSYATMMSITTTRRIIGANLEGGYPVLMAIVGRSGHEVVADGYGYNYGTIYHHVNMGWGGSQDAWYNLPVVDDAYYGFSSIWAITGNVFPDRTGEIISGRVVTANGNAVPGVEIAAQAPGGGPIYNDTTDSQGYYGVVVPSGNSYNIAAAKAGYEPVQLSGIRVGQSGPYETGNYWGANILLGSETPFSFRCVPLQTSAYLTWTDPTAVGMPSRMVYIRRSAVDYPCCRNDGTLVYSGSASWFEDQSLLPSSTYYYTIWLDNGEAYADAPGGRPFARTATPDSGRAKILWRDATTGNISCWFLNAQGVLKGSCPVYERGITSDWAIAGLGDINRDGIDDLFWRNEGTGTMAFWKLDRFARLTGGGVVHPGGASSDWVVAGVGDVDGDGTCDLIWHNQNDGSVVAWLLYSNGSRRQARRMFPGSVAREWAIVGVGDVDGNRCADLLWRHGTSGKLAYWILKRDGTLNRGGLVHDGDVPLSWSVLGTGDLNRDGTVDVLWRNDSTGTVTYWLLGANGRRVGGGVVHRSTVSAEWAAAGVTDVNNDGVADILWHNASTGDVACWRLNVGGTLMSSALIEGSGSPSTWSVSGVAH
ncbi:MAG: C10 family peptidase [Planctomycetota bacterium]